MSARKYVVVVIITEQSDTSCENNCFIKITDYF